MRKLLYLASILVAACEPDLPQSQPAPVVTAVFDPTTSSIPLPNDLAFLNDANSTCEGGSDLPNGSPPACAQAELLRAFGGEFPSDQEVAITIDFTETSFNADGTVAGTTAPDLDLTSFNPETFFVFGVTAADQGEVPLEPFTDADYVKAADHGTLTIHHKGHEPWAPGSYAAFVRGAPDGVKTKDGLAVGPSPIFDIIAQGLDMTDPKNLGLLKAQTGSTADALVQGRQLNILIAMYKAGAYPAVDTRFPHQQLAIMTTFKIAPLVTNVTIDPARGLVPLPIDLLRDPTSGHLTALAACTLAGSSLDAQGHCPSPAAAGFQALDGFATTGAILGPTSELIQANTVTKTTLLLYDLTDPQNPAQVDPKDFIVEPCEFTSACNSPTALSPVIAIQPAGATAGDAFRGDTPSPFRTRPLKDNTDYAVVMTTGIHDKAGNSIGPGTVAKVLRFKNPVSVGGKSQLAGIGDDTAASVEKMRLQLQPVFGRLETMGLDSSRIGMAYTFHTQTILSQGVQLGALPYLAPAETGLPIAASFSAKTPAAAMTKYGVDQTLVPSGNIDEILEVDITAFDALDPLTGAFLTDPTQANLIPIHVLIATPKVTNPNVPACTGGLAPFGKCAPMMIFRHGLGGGRGDMLTVADSNAAAGMVTVAIDAAKHGDRSFCTSGTSGAASGCADGGMCMTSLPDGAQGDAHPPGTCAAGYAKHPVSATCTGACATAATDGIPFVSGNYLVSTNFFRTRDTFRSDIIDESQLTRAIAFIPTGAPPTGHAVLDHMVARGVIIDPARVYFSGQSLGAIHGTVDAATNPRISKAVLNVGGGTVVDIFTNSPAFKAQVDGLLAGLGIQRGTAKFLQFLVVAKTVLDPADPINFAGHLTANTLPNLLVDPSGATPQAAKKVLTQVAYCDAVVPNTFGFIHSTNVTTGPLPTGPTFFAPGGTGTFQLFVSPTFDPATFPSCANGVVEHGFYTDWVTPSLTQNAQNDAASFVTTDTNPLRLQHP